MKIQQKISAFIALVVVSSVVFAAPIYRWQDEEGRTWFSDQPVADVEAVQTSLQTTIPGGQKAVVDHPYSILKQVEYFQAQEARQQKLMLERKLAYQAMKAVEKQQNQVVMPPLDSGIPAIVSVPQYRPQLYPQLWPGNQYYRHQPHYAYRGSSLSYTHQGDHHRFSFNLGGLNYWNF